MATSRARPARRDADYIKLLRAALRSKILLLAIALLLTWGLWATLRAGEEKLPAAEAECQKQFQEVESKWGVPGDMPIVLRPDGSVDLLDLNKVQDPKAPIKDVSKFPKYLEELRAQANSCRQITNAGYIVKVRAPYLVEPISIDGQALASFWPFVMIAIGGAISIFWLRERTNTLVLAWFAFVNPVEEDSQLLRIRSDYRIGEVVKEIIGHNEFLSYRAPLIVQPESLLTLTVVGLIAYSSFSIGATHRIEQLHEMHTVLVDYFSGLWFFFVIMVWFVWKTKQHYLYSIERLVGRPIYGATRSRFHAPSTARDTRLSGSKWKLVVLGLKALINLVLPLTALGALALVWMQPGSVRGYRFLRGFSFSPIDRDLGRELQCQLALAVLFVMLCIAQFFMSNRVPEKWIRRFAKWTKGIGVVVALLVLNLWFHILILSSLADGSVYLVTFPEPRPLIQTDPDTGFIVFCLSVIFTVGGLFYANRQAQEGYSSNSAK